MDYFVVMALIAIPPFFMLSKVIHYFDVWFFISLKELGGLAPRHPHHRRRCPPLAFRYQTHHHLTLACFVNAFVASF